MNSVMDSLVSDWWCDPLPPIRAGAGWSVAWSSGDGLMYERSRCLFNGFYDPEPYPTPADYEPEVVYYPDTGPASCPRMARWSWRDASEVWA